ncbi:MAG: hypothetical protein AAB588_03580 [Patescibacteria group bacterium]
MQEKTAMLPQSNWKKMLVHIKTAGEDGSINHVQLGDDYQCWEDIGVFSISAPGELTEAGKAIFESLYIRCDGEYMNILRQLLLAFPPTVAVQQYLWGVAKITIAQVLTVLKTTGFWFYDSSEPLTHFLDLLNYTGIVSYQKKVRQLKILVSPDTPAVPKNVFIDPSRPFSNIIWVKRILGECEGSIYWLDKHFQKEALEWLWAVADANKIKEIRILSLDLHDKNLSADAKKEYRRFKCEMNNKGIHVIWATIDSREIRDVHDRWIIGENEYLRNVPNVNAISSGQRSEMNYSENYDEASSAFAGYWPKAVEV